MSLHQPGREGALSSGEIEILGREELSLSVQGRGVPRVFHRIRLRLGGNLRVSLGIFCAIFGSVAVVIY